MCATVHIILIEEIKHPVSMKVWTYETKDETLDIIASWKLCSGSVSSCILFGTFYKDRSVSIGVPNQIEKKRNIRSTKYMLVKNL